MFRRTFWFTAGAAAGVWATTKVNRKLKQLTPESLAAQAANKAVDAGHRVREFALDVRAGMLQREAELGDALGLHDPVDHHELPAPRRAALDSYPPVGPNAPEHLGHRTRSDLYSHKDNRNEDH
ncbi:DUF6167 family protein [Streptomyces sp. NPDC059578]|uniref:DUF6167 family protein n=1 Tax=unclassified Streptomyces TaxID=2593676 RepID=UPI0036600F71